MTKSFKAAAFSSLTALAIVALASATPAEAAWRHGYGYGWGGGAALGVMGLAAGAIIASQAQPYYGYAPACFIEQRPVLNRHGYVVGYRNVRICE